MNFDEMALDELTWHHILIYYAVSNDLPIITEIVLP